MNRAQIAALVLSTPGEHNHKLYRNAGDPLAPIAGLSTAGWVVDACVAASVRRIAIVGSSPELPTRSELTARHDDVVVELAASTVDDSVESVTLAIELLGPELALSDSAHLLLAPIEVPHVQAAQLRSLIERHVASGSAATVLTRSSAGDREPDITRDLSTGVTTIVDPMAREHDDVLVACVRASLLVPALRRCTPPGWKHEVLLGEAVATLERAGYAVDRLEPDWPLAPITDARSRVAVERVLRDRIILHWIDRGVAITHPGSVSIDATVQLGRGVELHPGSVIEGRTVVGDVACIGPNTHLVNATIGTDVHAPNVAVYNVDIPPHSRLTPFTLHGTREPRTATERSI